MVAFQDAFISYGRTDSKAFAIRLKDRLAAAGLTVWFDFDDIPLATDFQERIDNGIERSHAFLYVISPSSVNSAYCDKELNLALRCGKRIIPIMHVEAIDRDIWQQRNPNGTEENWQAFQAEKKHNTDNLNKTVGKLNWVLFSEGHDFEQSLQGLLALFPLHQDYVQRHTQLLLQALTWERNHRQTRYLLVGNERIDAEQWLNIHFADEAAPCEPTPLHCEFITEATKNANNLMTQVFLCHDDQDQDTAEQIRQSLMRRGITVWNYRTDIQTSQDYHGAIARGVEEADNVIFILSPHAAQSDYCQRELAMALRLYKRVIPILAAPTDDGMVPDSLKSLQYVDLTDNRQASDYLADESELLKQLNTEAAYYTEHKTWLTQALKWERQQQNPTMLLRGYNLRRAESWLKVARTHGQPPTELQEQFIAESLRQPSDGALDVFVSYSRVDADFARRLNEALQIQGKRTWFDQESIATGSDFQQEIYRGIESSDVFLFVLSPQSVASPYCADEVEYAESLNKRMVTVLHRPVDVENLHPVLAKLQWLDFRDHDGDFQVNFQELLRTLDTDREHLETHTRLLGRALEWDRGGRDESLLLRGQNLESAEGWLVSNGEVEPRPTGLQQEYVRAGRARQDAKAAAEKKLRRGALIGSVAAVAGILVSVGAGVAAFYVAKDANEKTTQAKERVADAEQKVIDADQKVAKADQELAKASQQTQQAQQQKEQAAQEQRKAELAAEEAEEKARVAEERARAADGKAEAAATAQQEAESAAQTADQKAQTAERRSLEADAKALLAEEAQRLAEVGTRLEQAGVAALNRMEFDQIGALLKAIDAGRKLQEEVENNDLRNVFDYPAASPILALQRLQVTAADRLLVHQGNNGVTHASFNAAGTQVVTASFDGTARVWDLSNGEFQPLEGHSGPVTHASFNAAGTQVLTASADGTARVWDLSSGEFQPLEGHEFFVNHASFNAAGTQVLTASVDGTARVWDLSSGKFQPLEGHEFSVNHASFNAAGTQVLTASFDGTARVWDLSSGEFQTLEGHQGWVNHASFNAAGTQVLTASADGTARVWDLSSGEFQTLEGHQGSVIHASFNAAGTQVLTASADGTARVWDLSSGEFQLLEGHGLSVNHASFNAAGTQVVTASADGTARMWNLGSSEFQPLEGHASPVSHASFNAAGTQVVTASWDGTARVWDLSSGKFQPLEGHEFSVNHASFNAAGTQVVTASEDGTARVWDLSSGEFQTLEGHQDSVIHASFNAAGTQVVTASWDGTARVWDLSNGEFQLLEGHADTVIYASFNVAGTQVVTASEDGTARVWDLSNGKFQPLEGHADTVIHVSFNAAGTQVVTASVDGTARVWDLSSGESQLLEGHQGWVNHASFNAAGTQVVTASVDGTARVWDLSSDESQLLEGHQSWVNHASFNAAGTQVVTASGDGTARVWDLKGRQLAIFEGTLGTLSTDSQHVATVHAGKVKIHEILTLPELIDWGCQSLDNYLKYGPAYGATDADRALCNLPPRDDTPQPDTVSSANTSATLAVSPFVSDMVHSAMVDPSFFKSAPQTDA